MREWLQIARRRDISVRALKVALVVGTVLVAINQGDLLLAGVITPEIVTKILLTYCVPYCVSTYAGVEAVRSQAKGR